MGGKKKGQKNPQAYIPFAWDPQDIQLFTKSQLYKSIHNFKKLMPIHHPGPIAQTLSSTNYSICQKLLIDFPQQYFLESHNQIGQRKDY